MKTGSESADIKSRIAPAAFYAAELPGMPEPRHDFGWTDGGLCPFHDDHRAGSFRVSLDTGAYVCFSCGAHGGDILAFMQQRDGITFRQAIGRLANEWGV